MEYGFKGFNSNLTCRGYKYKQNRWNVLNKNYAQCHSHGFHCAVNPLDCISNGYAWDNSNRFFRVALDGDKGDIHQDDAYDTQLSGTRMYLVKELTLQEFVFFSMNYIHEHKYEKLHSLIKIDKAENDNEPFSIIYGKEPIVKGNRGQVVGLIKVDNDNNVLAMNIFEIDGKKHKANIWYDVLGNEVVI